MVVEVYELTAEGGRGRCVSGNGGLIIGGVAAGHRGPARPQSSISAELVVTQQCPHGYEVDIVEVWAYDAKRVEQATES